MEKESVLILTDSSQLNWVIYAEGQGYIVSQVFKEANLFGRIIRKFDLKYLGNKGIERWGGEWRKNILQYRTIIIFANKLYYSVIKWMNTCYPQIRIIVWYWNPVSSCKLDLKDLKNVECWSFDKEDCLHYGFKYNTTFYTPDISEDQGSNKIIYDAFFVGEDKGRYFLLKNLEKELNAQGLITKFIITSPRWTNIKLNKLWKMKKRNYDKAISYAEVIHYIKQSKMIVDIYQKGQTGLSLRPMEALFYKKKILTNNKYIKQSNFYNENNIFLLGKDNVSSIKCFLEKPYQKIDFNILESYSFEAWFKRFFIEE